MIRQRRDRILTLLAELEGKDEWTLNTRWDEELLAAVVRHTTPELAALAADADRLPEGHAYFARKKLQKAVCDAVAARRALVNQSLQSGSRLQRFRSQRPINSAPARSNARSAAWPSWFPARV